MQPAFEIMKCSMYHISTPSPHPPKVMRKETSRNNNDKKSKHTIQKGFFTFRKISSIDLDAEVQQVSVRTERLETVIHSILWRWGGSLVLIKGLICVKAETDMFCATRRHPLSALSMQAFSIAFRCVWILSTTVFPDIVHPIS